MLREVQKVLNEAQMPLMPNEEYKFVFREKLASLRIIWKGQKLLTDTLNNLKRTRCNGKRCQVCQYIEKTGELVIGISTIFVKE